MLRQKVIDAVRQGKFHIYAVCAIDEGMEIRTGVPIGERKNGRFPKESIGFLVDKTLQGMADKLKRYVTPSENAEKRK